MPRAASIALILVLVAGDAQAGWPRADAPQRTVVLIRHGEYDHDDESIDEGHLDTLGRQQARLLAERLDAVPVAFDSIQASTLNRARETAEIIAERFPDVSVSLHDDLRECTMRTRRQDIMDDLEPGEAEACEETLEKAFARILQPAVGRDAFDVVVCHGNVIRWMVCRILDVDPTAWLQMSIANCSITVVQVQADGSMKLISFADSGHVPYSMTTYPGTKAPQ